MKFSHLGFNGNQVTGPQPLTAVTNITYKGKIDEIAPITKIRYFIVVVDRLHRKRDQSLGMNHPSSGQPSDGLRRLLLIKVAKPKRRARRVLRKQKVNLAILSLIFAAISRKEFQWIVVS